MVDSSQAVTGTLTTEAFGNTVRLGYRDDGDAGLLHVGARYYDPQVGRFISSDDDLDEHPTCTVTMAPSTTQTPGRQKRSR